MKVKIAFFDWDNWEKEKVNTYEILATEVAPGLIVHREVLISGKQSRWWKVTHQASGYYIWNSFNRKARAVAFALAIAPLCDWTLPKKKLCALLNSRDLEERLQQIGVYVEIGPVRVILPRKEVRDDYV